MSAPTSATVSLQINATADEVFDLVADVTRMGEWSPECVRCEWQGAPGAVGSTFKGHNKRGMMRWSTTAKVLVADRGREFTFVTMSGDRESTRWSYRFEGSGPTTVTESFTAIYTPPLVALAERVLMRGRQAEIERGMATTLERIKAAAEG